MNEQNNNEPTLSFKSPRGTEWKRLKPKVDLDDEKSLVRQNQSELHNMLRASLQMQNLIVLSGSGCSLGDVGGPSMHDLWCEIVKENATEFTTVVEKVGHNPKNENIEVLLSRAEAFLSLNDDEEDIKSFLNKSKKIIVDKCTEFLTNDEQLKAHKTFIHRLSRRRTRDHRLKIFTTNYDLCFERSASALGIVAIDGFSFSLPRRFDPRYFNYDIVRRSRNGDESATYLEGVFLLYKLHGSVNWAHDEHGNIIEKERPTPKEACLIYPAEGKYQQSFKQPHLEFIAQYLSAVREPNTCIIVTGFGFNDDHLSAPLISAISSNPHLRLIVVDPAAKDKLDEENTHWKRLKELNAQGEDIWFVSANFGQFSELIPDLKSLTPADALAKAVQEIARSEGNGH